MNSQFIIPTFISFQVNFPYISGKSSKIGGDMYTHYGLDAVWYDLYISFSMGNEDVNFYVEAAKHINGSVLELGCGTGRILIPTAKAGVIITGLDLSEDMLKQCRMKLENLDAKTTDRITLVRENMINFKFDHQFNLITIPFRAFLHLLTVDDQKKCLRNIHKHLTDDGKLIFNIFDPNLNIIHAHMGSIGQALKKSHDFTCPITNHKIVCWDSREYDLETQTLNETRIYEELDDGKVLDKYYVPLELRFNYRYETQHLLELCGYKIEALYGDFNRGPFIAGREQIWVCGKG